MYYYSTKHKVFISFYHHDDQKYKDYIDTYLSSDIINKSVMDGEYDPDDSDEYIKRLIREEKITDSSVVLVLVGPNTKYRKHVDWEIYAGLRASVNGRAGLAGILLPEILTDDGKYYPKDLPARLNDNVDSGYAKVYSWDYAINHFTSVVNTAFDDRITLKDKADNSRQQMKINGHN
jgi:hypothetical protein